MEFAHQRIHVGTGCPQAWPAVSQPAEKAPWALGRYRDVKYPQPKAKIGIMRKKKKPSGGGQW